MERFFIVCWNEFSKVRLARVWACGPGGGGSYKNGSHWSGAALFATRWIPRSGAVVLCVAGDRRE